MLLWTRDSSIMQFTYAAYVTKKCKMYELLLSLEPIKIDWHACERWSVGDSCSPPCSPTLKGKHTQTLVE